MEIPISVMVGEEVVFAGYCGTNIETDSKDKQPLVIAMKDLLAVIKK